MADGGCTVDGLDRDTLRGVQRCTLFGLDRDTLRGVQRCTLFLARLPAHVSFS